MTKIIAVLQEKGGTGKSTITTNLAGIASNSLRVCLIDADMPQGTSASWAAIRLEAKPGNLTIQTAGSYQELIAIVESMKAEHDLIIIDAPPRMAETTKAALILSDLALIPLGASTAELWATADLLSLIDEAKQIKPSIDARILWNRFRTTTKSARELSELVRQELKLKQISIKLGYRVAYSESLARGLSVMEWSDKAAQTEIKTLANELSQLLKINIFNEPKGKKK